MKYAVIEQTAGKVNVSKACRLLKVRRQGYYEYQARKGSPREVRDQLLTVKIKNIFYETGRIYGARKIREELRKGGDWVSRKRVRRLMDMAGKTLRQGVYGGDQGANRINFGLADVAKGIYLLEISNPAGKSVRKVTVQ